MNRVKKRQAVFQPSIPVIIQGFFASGSLQRAKNVLELAKRT
jgi:hypothetical protein